MIIYCHACNSDTDAVQTKGLQVHRDKPELHQLPFWQCNHCGNSVGCVTGTTKPTGPIAPEIENARDHIRELIKSEWKGGKIDVENIRSIDQARKLYKIVQNMIKGQELAT